MAIPNRESAEQQVWPGHAPVPAFETPLYLVGRKGLNLVDAIDDLDPSELARALNVRSAYGSPLETRRGQTALGTTAGVERVHSLFRLNDPGAGLFTRLAGSATSLYRGVSGALASVDTGYSGDPLTFTGITVPLTGSPYVVIADRSRQRKITRTGAIEPFGTAPATLTSVTLIGQSRKEICEFQAADGSNQAAWTYNSGFDRAATPNASGVPTGADIFGATAIEVTTQVGAATTGYYSFIGIARALDLTLLAPGIPASDDDHVHILFNISNPRWLEEIKIYFVVNGGFDPTSIPGVSGANTDAWFKSFRANDLQDYIQHRESGLDASEALRTRTLTEQFKTEQPGDDRDTLVNVTGALDLNRQEIPQIAAGMNIWGEFGILGVPLRRGEFQRIGTDTTRGWDTVTGIIIVIQTNAAQQLVVQLNDWFLYGGSGPDNSDPGSTKYDVRVINYHSITGSKGNPSAVQPEADRLDVLRQTIQVQPGATGIAAMRQHAYLRGGNAAGASDWFFAGENAADGGLINILVSDTERITAESLEIDNDQPVTSVNSAGATVLNQTLPIYFVVEDYCFGLGDPNQPGRLYRSKQGDMEAWPATDYSDVCPTTEELMHGGAVGSLGFVFSRSRMYTILLGGDGSWTTEPTNCAEGLVSRWALAVTPFGIAFVSPFGVRLTTGQAPERLSDEFIEPLFTGTTAGGLLPIDLTVPTALQLAYFDDELWLSYQDTGGARRQLIYNFFDKTWRPYRFSTPVATVYGEPVQGAAPTLLLGSDAAGAVYTHSGFTDLGTAIPYAFRTGAWDFGEPRREKLLAEIILDAELENGTITMQALLNNEGNAVTAQTVVGIAGHRRYTFEPFGTTPMHARNISLEVSGTAPTTAPLRFNRLGVTQQLQPEITYREATPWEELPGGEGYCYGMLLTCDTAGTPKTIVVEYTVNNGAVLVAATLTVTADRRRKLPFTWPAVLAQQIRLRPTGECEPWMRFKLEWLTDAEPPRLQGWDSNWQAFHTYADKWIKGYLIEADTFGNQKTVVLDLVDHNGIQQLAQNTLQLTRNTRGIYHHSFAKLRGRLFRLRATDNFFGKLYRWQPIFDEEPLSMTRWETQERPHAGMDGKWQKPLEAFLSLRSTIALRLEVSVYGMGSTLLAQTTYTIPSTSGQKSKVRVPLVATKGLLFVYLLTASQPFWVYREESELLVEDWATGQAAWVPLLPSNDDLDPARSMGDAATAAATPGGA